MALHPLDDAAAERDAQQPGEPRPAGSDTEDSLELTPPDVRREIESMVADPELDAVTERFAPDAPRDAPRRPDDSLSLSLEYGDISLDETGSTLPSMRSAQRSVQDYFDGTHSMSMSMEDVGDAIAAERDDAPAPRHEPAADKQEGDTTARRRAQAVLDARAIAPSNTGRNVAVVLLVLIALGLGGAGLLFKDRIVALFDARPSVVAQRPPPPPPRAAPAAGEQAGAAAAVGGRPAAADDRGAAAMAADERDALLRAAEAARAEERALAEAAAAAQAEMKARAGASAAAAAAAAPAAPTPADPARGSSESARTAAAAPSASASPPVALSEVLGQDGGSGAGVLPMAPSMQISRRRGPLRTHADLMQAFDAFQRGDDGSAMSAYQRILTREPRNRDALLGAAAVYMRGQAYERAAGQYMEVLRSYPRDPVAQAALISMQDDIDPVAAQSRLKLLLVASPQDPNLHFSLGNLYAGQGRWPEAQQAFFQAYRLDGENPDYAFNLAVSLDRLAQRAAAREYYARAGVLAATHPAAFDPAQARARLAALEPP
jgi:tetratricopeptide (TPR) repeat protein